MLAEVAVHAHHWRIDPPEGPTSHAVCECGAEADFANTLPEVTSSTIVTLVHGSRRAREEWNGYMLAARETVWQSDHSKELRTRRFRP